MEKLSAPINFTYGPERGEQQAGKGRVWWQEGQAGRDIALSKCSIRIQSPTAERFCAGKIMTNYESDYVLKKKMARTHSLGCTQDYVLVVLRPVVT